MPRFATRTFTLNPAGEDAVTFQPGQPVPDRFHNSVFVLANTQDPGAILSLNTLPAGDNHPVPGQPALAPAPENLTSTTVNVDAVTTAASKVERLRAELAAAERDHADAVQLRDATAQTGGVPVAGEGQQTADTVTDPLLTTTGGPSSSSTTTTTTTDAGGTSSTSSTTSGADGAQPTETKVGNTKVRQTSTGG